MKTRIYATPAVKGLILAVRGPSLDVERVKHRRAVSGYRDSDPEENTALLLCKAGRQHLFTC